MSGSRVSDMGKDKIRYLLFVSGRWRWQPTRAMRARGFKLTTFGKELPRPTGRARSRLTPSGIKSEPAPKRRL